MGIYEFIAGLSGKSQLLDLIGIFLAGYLGYILLLLFVIFLFLQKDWHRRLQLALFSALSVITSYGIIKGLINYFLFRERPFVLLNTVPLIAHEANASFPSGHAILFFTLAALMFFWIDRKWGIGFLISAGLIGAARVFVGVHFPIDVFAGALIGFVIPFLLKWLLPKTFALAPPPHQEELAE